MSIKMINVPLKIFLGLIVVSLTSVSIQLIPLFKQASSWNRCLKKTSVSLSQIKAFQQIDEQSKEVLSVMICNGAVFEPKFKTNIQ
tara:strand:- start:169 stop:426 length:258 start_codon:yes stop_codon:yes gene_type:complete